MRLHVLNTNLQFTSIYPYWLPPQNESKVTGWIHNVLPAFRESKLGLGVDLPRLTDLQRIKVGSPEHGVQYVSLHIIRSTKCVIVQPFSHSKRVSVLTECDCIPKIHHKVSVSCPPYTECLGCLGCLCFTGTDCISRVSQWNSDGVT